MMFTWNIAAVLTLQIVTGMLIYNVVKRKLVAHQGSHAVIEENGNHGYVNVPQEEETLNMNLLTNFESDSEENFAWKKNVLSFYATKILQVLLQV